MKDRVSLYPGRVKLVPVAGQENTYDMVRADSPTQEGTPLNKDSLLKDATAALYGLGSDAVPDEVFSLLKTLVDNAQSSADSKVKIQTGSYVGTGTHGEDSPCSLTFNFVPKVVYIIQSEIISVSANRGYDQIYPHFIQLVSKATSGVGTYAKYNTEDGKYIGDSQLVLCSFKDKTVSWYNCLAGFAYADNAINQMNNSGTTYYYIAIG